MTRKLAEIAKGFRQTSLKRVCASAAYPIVRGGIMFSGCSSVCACVAGRTHYPTGLPSTSSLLYCVCVTLLDDRHMQTDTQTDRHAHHNTPLPLGRRNNQRIVTSCRVLRASYAVAETRSTNALESPEILTIACPLVLFLAVPLSGNNPGQVFLHTRASVKQYKVVPVKRR